MGEDGLRKGGRLRDRHTGTQAQTDKTGRKTDKDRQRLFIMLPTEAAIFNGNSEEGKYIFTPDSRIQLTSFSFPDNGHLAAMGSNE